MRAWGIAAAVSGAVVVLVVALVVAIVVMGMREAARLDRRCTCGHTYGEHVSGDLMGFPCTACQTCAVFTAEGAS